MNYGDRIVYIDGTYNPTFQEAKEWAYVHGTTFTEDLSARDLPKRVFVIGEEPKQPEPEVPHEPTREEVEANRAFLYKELVDPITSHIQRLKDEEQTEEVLAEIEALKAERAEKIASIKEQNPYPVEPIEEIEELPVVEEAVVSKMENVEESEEVIEDGLQREEKEIEETVEPLELYSMEI